MAQNTNIGGGLSNLKTIFHDGPNGTLEGQQTQGLDFIDNLYANGFSVLQEQGAISNFEGIEGTTYVNPGILGTLGIQDTIADIHSTGFLPGLQQGDGTLFSGITGLTYVNTGNAGFGGGLDAHPIDYIDNTNANGFTENTQHLGPSDFIGIDLSGTPSTYNYTGGQNLGKAQYGGAGTGIDYIENIYATGFTKVRQHRDPSEFTMVGEEDAFQDLVVQSGGSLFNRMDTTGKTFPFGKESANKYLANPGTTNKPSTIDPDNVALLQQGGIRSIGNSSTLQGSEVTAITLEDMWNDHIGDLIDWEGAKGKTDGRLDPRWQSPSISSLGGGGFLPLTFSRGNEPYVVSPIGERNNIITAAIDDAGRLVKYGISADGIKFMAAQNVIGLASYHIGKKKKNGTSPDGTADRIGSLAASFGPRQQYQYVYNPLSVFSSSIPYVKVRFNRALLFDENTYLDREPGLIFGQDLTPNKNREIATTIPDFDNQKLDEGGMTPTTLGGSIQKNVNVSIDGTSVSSQGNTGDRMTLAAIADKSTINAEKKIFPEGDLESIHNGYPFYFKDLRNDRLLVFRGYIEDMNENITPNWNSEVYVGRSEPVYTYANTTRDMSFTLKLHANNYEEYKAIYKKLDYLTGMCYPEYFVDDSLGYTRPKPPLARMRLADLYGASAEGNQFPQLRDGILGFFSSINYTFEAPWDQFTAGERAPRFITAVIAWTALHDEAPNKRTQYYGVGGNYKAAELESDAN